jgi:hypothetical protein
MSEQTKIIAQMHEIIMKVLKSGSASVEEGNRLDELEEMLLKQKCFLEVNHPEHSCKGEEIANLFFNGDSEQAVNKMCEYEITPEDFFGFAEYHYEEEDETEMFTETFMLNAKKLYDEQCESN